MEGGGPAIDHNTDRRQEFDALVNPCWRFVSLTRMPYILLRTALFFYIAGLASRLWTFDPAMVCVISFLLMPALVGYIGTVCNRIRNRFQ